MDLWGGSISRSEVGKSIEGFLLSAPEHEPSWREWQPDDTDTEDEGWDELNTEGHSPRSTALVRVGRSANIVGSVGDPVGDKDTDWSQMSARARHEDDDDDDWTHR